MESFSITELVFFPKEQLLMCQICLFCPLKAPVKNGCATNEKILITLDEIEF
jgi:hypothetical protein